MLIRAAHSANIKERRDASSRAVRRRAARWSCRPSTSPCTSGRCPPRSPPCVDEDHDAAAARGSSTTPTAGGTHLPDITVITPVLADDGALARLRGQPRPPRRRRRPDARLDARRLDDARGRGRGASRRACSTTDAVDELVERMRQPAQRRADLRAQLAANRAGARRAARAARARRARHAAEAIARGARLRRAAHARLPGRARGRRARRRPTCSRPPRATSSCALTATVDGRRARRSTSPARADQHEGNLNCPLAVTRSACYFAVRVLTDPDIPPTRRRLPADRGPRARGLAAQRAARPPRWSAGNVETSSRVADLVLARVRPRARPGHDEQPHARHRRLHLLRDARRRPGRVRGRRRPERPSTWRCRTR